MLRSMTGFGDARAENERLRIAVEVRSVNNRYLKVATKAPDSYALFESEIEKLVRVTVNRGTVSVAIRADHVGAANGYKLDRETLRDYLEQLREVAGEVNVHTPDDLSCLLELPGVVVENTVAGSGRSDWPMVRTALTEAVGKLDAFRRTEGESMEVELRKNCKLIGDELGKIAERAPGVVRDYRDRLHERVGELLKGTEAEVGNAELIREVSIFADRCDINEEIIRLRSHLEQFEAFLNDKASLGRKLDFLSQEMFREVNTIGSKANDVIIAHTVVEMKSAVEKIREILQNVE